MLNRQDMHIWIDNLEYDSGTVTHQMSDIIDYVVQYRFQGGPEQPLRYLEMKVNKNDIDIAYPHLIDSVVEGKTRMLVDAVGSGTFVITKIWLTENTYELIATGLEVTMNTSSLSDADVSAINATNLDPPVIVKTLFDRWKADLNLSEGDEFRIYFSPSLDYTRCNSPTFTVADTTALISSATASAVKGDIAKVTADNSYYFYMGGGNTNIDNWQNRKITFKKNMPTLVAINMCALMDNAFIFFANKEWTDNGVTKKYNTMHYVTYDDIVPLAYNPADSTKNGIVNIYPRMDSQYERYTAFDLMMFKQIIGMSSKNSEGSETIVNTQAVSVDGSQVTFTDDDSIRTYGVYSGADVMSDMIVTANANVIAKNIVNRYKDPTRSITITLSETKTDSNGSGWEEAISPFSYAYQINDNVNNISLTNTHLCDGETDNFMLRLSTFIRSYPEITTEYTFGVMKETTLSQELANKLTGMSGNVADIRFRNDSLALNGVVKVEDILDVIYPVNSVYLATDNDSPAQKFDMGTWNSIGSFTVSSTTVYAWKRTN